MKTAVQWLVSELPHLEAKLLKKIIEQAKAMEKEQIMNAVFESMGTNIDPNLGRAEQYYNETYKQDDKI